MKERNIFYKYYDHLPKEMQDKVRHNFKTSEEPKKLSWESFLRKHSYKTLEELTIFLIKNYFKAFEMPKEKIREIVKETELL